MNTMFNAFNWKQKFAAFMLIVCLLAPTIACDDSSGDNPKIEQWQNDPAGALQESYNQAYDDSHLDEAACKAANGLVGDMTGQNYCDK